MDCDRFQKLISREIDGEIDDTDRESLRLHLTVCSDCRELHRSFGDIRDLHRNLAAALPPVTLLDDVMSVAPAATGTARGGWFKFAVSAAAALIMILGIQTGAYIASVYISPAREEQVRILDLDYLDPYAPDSFGELMLSAAEEVSDE
ncbi:MAG: zf-HC2 domain-containing protein [Candidatus Krumholzibacteriota bacterium]|nr:zf-HC2 domain-containing protein [Candidatus Krumholzibacteriota bacterium]